MIWLAWRQHRKQALFTLIGFAVLAAFMIPIGLSMRHTATELGLPECVRALARADVAPATANACQRSFRQFTNRYGVLNLVAVLLLLLPMLVGMFWGAPLVSREVEQGTHRLVWTQGISRTRWAVVQFGLVGAITVTFAVLYGLGMSWWIDPLIHATRQGRLGVITFDLQGVVPISYTLFAVALGVFAGTIWRRMLPAMAVTLGGFAIARGVLTLLARPHYLPASTLTVPVDAMTGGGPDLPRGDWVLSQGVRDATGKMVAPDSWIQCGSPPPGGGGGGACGGDVGIGPGAYNWELYQPADRYWPFQWIETGIFVALAVLLLYLAIRRIRRIA